MVVDLSLFGLRIESRVASHYREMKQHSFAHLKASWCVKFLNHRCQTRQHSLLCAGNTFPTPFSLFFTYAHAKVWWKSYLQHHLNWFHPHARRIAKNEYSMATLWWKTCSCCHFRCFIERNSYLQHYFDCFYSGMGYNLLMLPSIEIKDRSIPYHVHIYNIVYTLLMVV